MSPRVRVLVAGGDAPARAATAQLLADAGYPVVHEAVDLSSAERPFGLVVLLGPDAPQLCAAARQVPALGEVAIFACLAPGVAADVALAAGADDVGREPLVPPGLERPVAAALLDDLVARTLRAAVSRRTLAHAAACEAALLEIARRAGSDADLHVVLREMLLAALPLLGFARASVLVASDLSETAHVVAATDDPTLTKFGVELEIYPEIRAALAADEPLLLGDLAAYPPLAERAADLATRGVRSSAVFPLVYGGRVCGVILFRSPDVGVASSLGPRLRAFGGVVAALVAQRIGDGKVLASLREQTHRISLQRLETERRLNAIDQLRSYFEAASDGIVVVDAAGRILFVNRASQAISGFAREALVGRPLIDLVPPTQREGLEEVIYRVLGGTNLDAFDLELTTTSGDPICVSVATSTVLSDRGAAILSFRDVTAERALESELRKTKDFLEKLIDSTVDAIVAADVDGDMILFNPGAERLFGWTADEVIGRLSVERLYPDGVARQIMRMLRSASYGGVGRLELTRREIVTKDGEAVPVNMTASIIYEAGREVATVGILSDLRDRIRIEQRLLQAQEKLVLSEKQALVAELAGAAAHELNQPLTSVMGYAELLRRKMGSDDTHARILETILGESARMADIVKKIGRITRYETKAYVGSAQILDLEKSSGVAEPTFEEEATRPGSGTRS